MPSQCQCRAGRGVALPGEVRRVDTGPRSPERGHRSKTDASMLTCLGHRGVAASPEYQFRLTAAEAETEP